MSIGGTPENPLELRIYEDIAENREGTGEGSHKLRLHLGDDQRITPIYVKVIEDQKEFLREKNQFDQSKSLSLFRRWVPVTLKDAEGKEKYVLINIRSAAKRLGITREEVYKAAKEENVKQLLLLGQHLGRSELKKIDEFVNKNRAKLQKEAQSNDQGVVYKRASESGLRAGLQFNADGSVYIHFNKKRLKDPALGEGGIKRVRLAMNYDTKEICAVARLHKEGGIEDDKDLIASVQREFDFLQEFRGKEGVAQAIECVKVNGKVAKTFFIQPLYKEGDLHDVIHEKGGLTEREKAKVALDLLKGGAALEERRVIHRDIKPGNVFVSRDQEGELSAYIADFGFALRDGLEDHEKRKGCGTPPYFSPEYNAAVVEEERERKRGFPGIPSASTGAELDVSEAESDTSEIPSASTRVESDVRDATSASGTIGSAADRIERATTYKHDAWALGCIIYEMRRGEPLRKEEGDEYFDPLPPAGVSSREEDPLACLEYDLLRLDPNERLSAKEALEIYGPLLEQRLE